MVPGYGGGGHGSGGGGGGMLGGDMLTVYSTGSGCVIQDRQASPTDYVLPSDDSSFADGFVDWFLDSCTLSGGVLQFAAHRAFQTFDAHDLDFVTGPLTLLFSWSQTEPASATTLSFHTGGFSPMQVSLWGEAVSVLNTSALESDWDTQVLTMPGGPIGNGTSYTCWGFNLTEKLAQKTQAIAFEPVITPGNEAYVHHMVLYTCTVPVVGPPFSCFSMPSVCQGLLYAWGKGGGPFVLPPITGIEIGSANRSYVVLQMHYNNLNNDYIANDISGMAIYRTNQIRPTYSGMFVFGTMQLNIPAQKSAFSVSGDCPSALTAVLPPAGVTVYASFLHAHQRGRRIWTNQVRAGVTVDTMGDNQNYDFNLQKIQTLVPPVKLLPSDDLVTFCTYDTSNDTSTVSFGETTSNEMCFNFVVYYPILGTSPTYFCGTSGNPASASNPGATSCSLLPGQPPAAYTLNGATKADTNFHTGGSAACAPGFQGKAVLTCAGYGAPYVFSGCMRSEITSSAVRPTLSVAALFALRFLL